MGFYVLTRNVNRIFHCERFVFVKQKIYTCCNYMLYNNRSDMSEYW